MSYCCEVRTTGHWKGHPCGSRGVYAYNRKQYCANHFPVSDLLAENERLRKRVEELEGDLQIAWIQRDNYIDERKKTAEEIADWCDECKMDLAARAIRRKFIEDSKGESSGSKTN